MIYIRDFEAVQKTRGHALSGLKLSALPRAFKPDNTQIFSNSKIHENNWRQWIDYESWKNIRAKKGSVNCEQFSSALWNLNTFMHQPIIATRVEVLTGKGLGVDSGESGSAKVAQELWEGWGEMERWTLYLFPISHSNNRYTDSKYTLRLVNCERLLQDLCQSFGYGCAESNKHVKHVKPSPAFDILTWEMVFQELGRVVKALRFSLPVIFGSFAISLLACFFLLVCTDWEPGTG